MVQRVKRGFINSTLEFAHAARAFGHNARAYLFAAALQSFGGSMVGTVLALYIKSAGMRESTIGDVEGSFALGMAAVALIGPPLVSTLGYRRLMLGALALLVASRVAQAIVPTPVALIVFAVAVGVGDGFLRTVNSAFLSENSSQKERTHLFSADFLVRMIAIFAGGVLGGLVPGWIGGTEQSGLQWTITAGSALMATGLVPMFFVREQIHGVKGFAKVYLHSSKNFSAWGHLARLIAPQAFLAAAGGLTAPFVPLYLKNTLGASVAQIGLIQGFGALAVGLAAFSTPLLARKIGVSRSVMLLQVAALPFLFMVPWIGTLTFGALTLFTRSALMGIGGPLWNEKSMDGVKAADKPLVAGGLFFALSMAGFGGNVLGGRLMEISYTAPYIPAALLWAAGTALTWLLWVRPQATAENARVQAPHFELQAEAA